MLMLNAAEVNTDFLEHSHSSKKQFVLCNECFWCCSALSTRLFDIDMCPNCKKSVSAMPIENNEMYSYNYTHSRGVEVAFQSNR
jgi:hypothetical protein